MPFPNRTANEDSRDHTTGQEYPVRLRLRLRLAIGLTLTLKVVGMLLGTAWVYASRAQLF